jgi:hypothetical protein
VAVADEQKVLAAAPLAPTACIKLILAKHGEAMNRKIDKNRINRFMIPPIV